MSEAITLTALTKRIALLLQLTVHSLTLVCVLVHFHDLVEPTLSDISGDCEYGYDCNCDRKDCHR